MTNETRRWIVVIPPDGAARTVAHNAFNALAKETGSGNVKNFDSLIYLSAFKKLLKTPDENMVVDLMNQSLLTTVLDFGANYVLTGALSPVTLFILNILKKQNIITIHWFYEDYRRAGYWNDIISGYSHFCAIQRGILPKVCLQNNSTFHFLNTALSFEPRLNSFNPRKYDITFIGIPSTYRIRILEKIVTAGFTCAIAGSGWESYDGPLNSCLINRMWTDSTQVESILSAGLIGINLSLEEPLCRDDVHISPRVYDILACKAVLLTEDVPLIRDALADCTYITFTSPDDCIVKIRYILDNAHLLQESLTVNFNTVITRHTYRNRIQQLIEFVAH
ncbi:MAG: glycosyltransferase family 1 protein [Fibrobacter sp.]|nr:glycosyltransferase family 1 protein [Fibrobacter sp.]